MVVSIKEIDDMLHYIRLVNAVPFNDIRWMDSDGEQFDIPDEIREEFKFTGLSNCSFVEMEFWHCIAYAPAKIEEMK